MLPILKKYALLGCLATTLILQSCTQDKNGDRLIFSIEDDINLGAQVSQEVDSTYRAKGQLLDPANPANKAAYDHLNRIVNRILSSGKVSYRNEFAWDTKIIKDDNVLNAFATPGGHIYVFSGLIKYLDNEDQFAGVLGHEIAHADQRHSTKQLQRQYGLSILLSVALGDNPGTLTQIATSLATLKFDRDAETEADAYSVIYLGGTNYYACNGAAGFFEKILSGDQQGRTPEFLSTHPDPGNRVQNINNKAAADGCKTQLSGATTYQDFKNSLK
ncbi:M48 family metalloprotease [Adhaeribacter pallidiroseus]|uniref:Beta-barrel assembly-enhancing protease n=1 Tax=Adhaeribacter pallidiroseus TaxID=2072847 RepID=A0A369QF29_9BACT|nr:M48 family metalloprotease [Adhaeribacter pallidiroseus]RDC63032.1 Beta-barrel assembly-enhancing protease [Adhaeribacter pallidiroseus]